MGSTADQATSGFGAAVPQPPHCVGGAQCSAHSAAASSFSAAPSTATTSAGAALSSGLAAPSGAAAEAPQLALPSPAAAAVGAERLPAWAPVGWQLAMAVALLAALCALMVFRRMVRRAALQQRRRQPCQDGASCGSGRRRVHGESQAETVEKLQAAAEAEEEEEQGRGLHRVQTAPGRIASQDGSALQGLAAADSQEAAVRSALPPVASDAEGGHALMEHPVLEAPMADGEGVYVWPDGSTYSGEWHHGLAEGRGTFTWPNGARHEGEWRAGLEGGAGTFSSVDGSTYYGTWLLGSMHGEGVYKPAAAGNKRAEVIFLREYNRGKLTSENVLRVQETDMLKRQQKKAAKKAKHLSRGRSVVRAGETIIKGHRSYDLVKDLQLGIMFSIAKAGNDASVVPPSSQAQARRELSDADFKRELDQYFPAGSAGGSEDNSSFKWRDYCPAVFHQLREAFGLDQQDYLLSLTGDAALRELPSPGKSGSVFFLSDDDRFLIKTVRREEMKLLMEFIPHYYAHVRQNPHTILTRFYGVHRVKILNGRKVRFVVMGNVFPTDVRLHRKYDLKGSTYGRTVGPERAADPNTVLKDLDFDMQLQLSTEHCRALMAQIRADTLLLERLHVMDYSLLLGVYFVEWGEDEWHPPHTFAVGGSAEVAADVEEVPALEPATSHTLRRFGSFSITGRLAIRDAREDREGDPPRSGSPTRQRASHVADFPLELIQSAAQEAEPATPHASLRRTTAVDGESPAADWSIPSRPRQSRDGRASGTFGPRQRRRSTEASGLASIASPPESQRGSEAPGQIAGGTMRSEADGELQGVYQRQRPVVQYIPVSPFASAADDSPSSSPSQQQSRSLEQAAGDVVRVAEPNGSPAVPDSPSPRRNFNFEVTVQTAAAVGMSRVGSTGGSAVNRGGKGASLDLRRSSSGDGFEGMGYAPGCGIAAMAVPRDGSRPQPVVLYFGIIDFLQEYGMRKRMEHFVKSTVRDGRTISVTEPKTYGARFREFMEKVFITKD